MRLFCFDVETCSATDLPKVGAYLYARHPSTLVHCVSYCLIDAGVRGPIETWVPGDPVPASWRTVAADPEIPVCAFNIPFDGQILEHVLVPHHGFPPIARERWRCAQAAVLARALPGSLDAAAKALKIEGKDKAGAALMRRLAKPRQQTKKQRKAGVPLDFSVTPAELAVLVNYNVVDVRVLMDIIDRIGLISSAEQAVWQLCETINERGVHFDVPLLDAALAIVKEAKIDINNRLAELTDGVVTGPQQTERIRKWLAEHDCKLSNVRKGTIADALLEPGLPEPARRLLELRQSGAGAAPSKLPTLRRWADERDHRIRGAYRYHGSSPGRFTSLGCQLHNLKKPEMADIAGAIAAIGAGSLAEVRARGFEQPLEMVGQLARAFPTPAPGKRFMLADLSGIEARGAALVVGDARELEQWRTFDRTGRPEDEPYYIAGIKTFQQPPSSARKAGKTGQLAFQYGGSVGAYRKITGDQTTPEEVVLQRCHAWRADHPLYTQFWKLVIFQAVQAIRHPGTAFTAKVVALKYDARTGFLELTLPSGRVLNYPRAELCKDEQYDSTSFTFLDASKGGGRMYHEWKGSGAWGGLMIENITQALCRDVFVEGMLRLEAAGYAIVMHTHDDFVVEIDQDFGSLEEFTRLITMPPAWAPDLPIAAKARISDRFIEIPEPAQVAAIITDNVLDNAAEDLREEADAIASTEPAEEVEDEVGIDAEADAEIEAPAIPAFVPEPEDDPVTVASIPFMITRAMRAQLHAQGFSEQAIVEMTPAQAHSHLGVHPMAAAPIEAAPTPGPGPIDRAPVSYGTKSNGHAAGNGYGRGEDHPAGSATVAEYIYRAADKKMWMRVLRTAAHTFPTFHWADGAWVAKWPPTVVPYKLPELLAAPADALVLICEGEKDCETAIRLGYVATCNPGGAEHWQPELAQYFQGKQRACIVEDHDTPGAAHTALILKALAGVVPHIGVLRFPELEPGGDLTKYFEDGGSKSGLDIRIARAMQTGAGLDFTLESLDGPVVDLEFLWPGHFPLGALELSAGQVSIGKSLAYCDFCAIITTGRDWPDGAPGPVPGNVIILSAEDRVSDYKRRLAAAGADRSKVKMLTFVRRDGRDDALFELDKDLDKLEQAIVHLGDVRLVIIDPITAFMGHDKNFDSHRVSDVRSQLHPLSRLAEKLDVPFGLVTHPPKNASARTVLDNYIGSQAFIAAARVGHYFVEELGEEDDRGFRRPTGRIFFITPKTSHSDRALARTLAFRIEAVPVGWNAVKGREIRAPRIVWETEPIDLTADEAVQANKFAPLDRRKARSVSVKEFLRDILAAGPVARNTVVERGAGKGFSLRQLQAALKAIDGKTFKALGDRYAPWFWCQAEHKPAGAESREEEEDHTA